LPPQKVIDRAIQAFGAAGLSEDFGLAAAFAGARSLRLADGPDEVHTEWRCEARVVVGAAQHELIVWRAHAAGSYDDHRQAGAAGAQG
jgi:hypothetical protein